MSQVQRSRSARATASNLQAETRQVQGFEEHEHSLSELWPTQKPTRVSRTRSFGKTSAVSSLGSWLHYLLSYLGTRNPLPKSITDKDVVWLFDNTAYLSDDATNPGGAGARTWKAEFIAATFGQAPTDDRGIELLPILEDAANKVAKMIGLADNAAERDTVRRRLVPFFQEIRPGRRVVLDCGRDFDHRMGSSSGSDGEPIKENPGFVTRMKRRASSLVGSDERLLYLGPGGRNGISSDTKAFPGTSGAVAVSSGAFVNSKAKVPQRVQGVLDMHTFFAEPEGWGLISDIDDTIKITMTSSPTGILESTFVSEPTPIAGMPELYARIRHLITPSAPIFYLSASPYNLYPFLRGFRDRFYPFGPIMLREASWQSLPGLLSNLTLGTQDYKEDRIRQLHGWLPRRKMICFGDSTQSDPEAYGDMYRAFPGWIRLVCIRRVTAIAAIGMQAKNAPERFERAFDGLPRSAWHVFDDPAECYRLIEETVARG